jgi:hypothetical protein
MASDTEPPAPTKSELRALTLTPPWWWFMLHLPPELRKGIENRPTGFVFKSFRGEFLLHAGKDKGPAAFARACEMASAIISKLLKPGEDIAFPSYDWFRAHRSGGIVGKARITGIVPPGDSGRPWHFPEQYGFVVEYAEPFPFVPCKGALGFWRVPENVIGELREKGAQL